MQKCLKALENSTCVIYNRCEYRHFATRRSLSTCTIQATCSIIYPNGTYSKGAKYEIYIPSPQHDRKRQVIRKRDFAI